MRLNLPDVTLVAIDTACHNLTWMAINECLAQADFGDIQVFMNWKGMRACNYIDKFTKVEDGLEFLLRLPKHIKTSHVLFIQWDSWIIDPDMWTDEFLKYDWVGAPWWYGDNHNVGNSGFSIQSKKMMEFFAENKKEFPLDKSYDHLICREYQPRLPQFKWAPEGLASQFAFERSRPSVDSRHFGFHGVFNWPFVMKPKQLAERMKIARDIPYLRNALAQVEQTQAHWHKLEGSHG